MFGSSEMHLAILITNTDFSPFAAARPDDGEKFADLVALARPAWHCQAFWVCKGEFPQYISMFDGVLVTGSPASVFEEAPWMLRLEQLVHEMITTQVPLFGACFGHQIIAKTLGAPLGRNPEGWGHGRLVLTRTGLASWSGTDPEVALGEKIALYGSHMEQVTQAPDGAQVLFEGPGLPVAGFALGETVFTVQHHPEMTAEFIADLVEEYAEALGPEVTERARASLGAAVDRAGFAQEIARFFEHAARHGHRGPTTGQVT